MRQGTERFLFFWMLIFRAFLDCINCKCLEWESQELSYILREVIDATTSIVSFRIRKKIRLENCWDPFEAAKENYQQNISIVADKQVLACSDPYDHRKRQSHSE